MLEPLRDVIADEANVKDVVFADDPAAFGTEVLSVNPRIVGKRLGRAMKDVLAAAQGRPVEATSAAARSRSPARRSSAGEYELRFKAAGGPRRRVSFDGSAGVVVLDTDVDAELEREGLARDFIRLVQVARKDAGFNVADRIHIEVRAGGRRRRRHRRACRHDQRRGAGGEPHARHRRAGRVRVRAARSARRKWSSAIRPAT